MIRELIDATIILALSAGITWWGEPQPLSILVGAAGTLTGAFILIRLATRSRGR